MSIGAVILFKPIWQMIEILTRVVDPFVTFPGQKPAPYYRDTQKDLFYLVSHPDPIECIVPHKRNDVEKRKSRGKGNDEDWSAKKLFSFGLRVGGNVSHNAENEN